MTDFNPENWKTLSITMPTRLTPTQEIAGPFAQSYRLNPADEKIALGDKPTGPGKSFNLQAESKYVLWGHSPQTYEQVRDRNGAVSMDGNRALELTSKPGDWSFIAGSMRPQNGPARETRENWFLNLAYTPLQGTSQQGTNWRAGLMVGDYAETDTSGQRAGFSRIGASVGLYATTEPKEGGIGAFVKLETDPRDNNKPRVTIGVKTNFDKLRP